MPCRCGAGVPSQQLTEDEQRAARTAEIAAAEDFDPLRIRPYVTLSDHSGTGGGEAGGPRSGPGAREGTATGTWDGARPSGMRDDAASRTQEGTAPGTGAPAPDADRTATETAGAAIGPGAAATTMPLFLGGDGPNGGMGAGTGAGVGRGAVPDDRGAVPDGSRRRTPGATPVFAPDPVRPRRRRPLGALAVGAAVAAVVGTAAFAGGLFGVDDSGDEALPEATTSVPDTEADEPAASVAPSPTASATPPRTQSPSAAPSAPPSASASPTESREPEPTATTSAPASPTASASPTPDGGAPPAAPPADPPPGLAGSSLRPGDRGPEVAELQTRLRTVGEWLYSGPVDGSSYSDQVAYSVAIYQSYKAIQGDPTGVYGPNTRRALEAETNGRGRHRAH
ncbi:peptidoglycan-binding domain-containing protein [Streptomyces sp. CA-278952]|uniref:peptidoglycan-binding domain-containing protein n=1 Tax=Streptomyces sp. CA-278952 TaxID=2980556 RepID=UPI002367DE9B|nr:peptidoglycan-binding domain-containing protein [Streptomyces sp. CA-278952]WDG33672.1 peptidoglycan-binding domain-containing protein [Streptomyces sp. CA-278952]